MSIIKKLILKFQNIQFYRQEQKSREKMRALHQYDQKLVQTLSAKSKIPTLKQISYISKYFSRGEQYVFRILIGLIIVSTASLCLNYYWQNSVQIPADGGSYTEGLVGSPRYINPLYAQASDVDLDLSGIIYSGLMKYSDAGLEKDLAANYSVSDDQKIYTFELRKNVVWHDGEPFNADDVIFTFQTITDPKTKSPLLFTFRGITVEKIDDYTVRFTLTEPFAPFLESLSIGILPAHIWTNITPENFMLADYNLKPIGTGPFKFKSLVKNKNGTIKTFNLERNTSYYNQPPHIEDLSFKFMEKFDVGVEALNNKNVEGLSFLPKDLRDRIINNRNLNFHLLHLPQYTAVFFNYAKNPVLKEASMRKLLSASVNKDKIINEILNAEARSIDTCILPDSLGYNPDIAKYPYNSSYVKDELEKLGWTLADYATVKAGENEATTPEDEYPFQVRKLKTKYLEFALTTVNQPENVQIAKELQKEWQQIGAKVNLVIVNQDKIQETIKTRDYEVLLYGQILGYDPDPYPFWHSSERTYPGLNLTSLEDANIDKLLVEARKTANESDRAAKYSEFQKLLAEQAPAIFLFNPTYTYPQNKKVKGFNTSKILTPANRFSQINTWYVKTDRKWK